MSDVSQLRLVVILLPLINALLLVILLKYDLRIDRAMSREALWRTPTLNRLWSIFKLTLKYLLLGLLFGLILAAAWSFLADHFGWSNLPGLNLDMIKSRRAAEASGFWYLTAGVIALLVFLDLFSCLITPIWDIFISYKSEDVALARAVADHFLSLGVRVWFAEYQVLLQNYSRFQKAIDYGLRNSGAAILFTNNRYINSPYCRHEVEQLLKRLPPEKIFEIMIPYEDQPHSHYRSLADSPGYEGDDLAGILAFLYRSLGLAGTPAFAKIPSKMPQLYESVCLGRTFTLDISAWEIQERGQVDQYGNIGGLALHYRAPQDQFVLNVNLFCGREHSYQGQRTAQTRDDRQMYQALFETAQKHIRDLHLKLRGLHLYNHSGLSQMALTYLIAYSYWTRKYSIIIPHKVSGENAEFVFTFGYLGRFHDYLKAVPHMDHLVSSLNWGGELAHEPEEADQSAAPARELSPQQRRNRAIELTNRGYDLVEQRQFEAAVSALQQAIAIDPNYGHAYNELAFLYGRVLGQLDLGEGYARRAVECEPNNAKFQNAVNGIQMLRVKQLHTKRKISEAMNRRLQEIQESIEKDPFYPSTHLTRAAALALSGADESSWEAELEEAKRIYLASGKSGAGTEITPQDVEQILDRSRKECQEMAAFWVQAPAR